MTPAVKLLFFAGSARQGSYNRRLAKLAADIAKANGLSSTLLELRDYPMPIYDGDVEAAEGPPENARKLKKVMAEHGGIFIAAPEYNASITPLLKNTLDWVSRVRGENEAPLEVFRTRVFALASASPGGFGGMRGLIVLRQTLQLGLGALVLPEQLSIARAGEAFDDHGHLKDKGQQASLKSIIRKLAETGRLLQG
jgi:NAD(P)H-dependent FMN reductase